MNYQLIISLLTGQYGVLKVGTTSWIWAAVAAGVSLYQGYTKSKAAKAGGEASRNVSYENAADLREFAGINADLILGAAGRNAEAQLTIGEANASSVERATTRNMMLYGMQAEEEGRRHIYGERMSAGRVRSMVGAAGVQTNTGTPLMFLYAQVDEGIRQRKFMEAKQAQTLWTMAEEGKDRAGILRLTASENAAVIMTNAEAQAEVSILDASRQASSIERGGDLARSTGNSVGNAALIGGVVGAVGSFANAGGFNTSSAPTATGTSFSSNWQQAGGWSTSGFGNSTTIGSGAFAGLNAGGGYLGGPSGISTGFTSSWNN